MAYLKKLPFHVDENWYTSGFQYEEFKYAVILMIFLTVAMETVDTMHLQGTHLGEIHEALSI